MDNGLSFSLVCSVFQSFLLFGIDKVHTWCCKEPRNSVIRFLVREGMLEGGEMRVWRLPPTLLWSPVIMNVVLWCYLLLAALLIA